MLENVTEGRGLEKPRPHAFRGKSPQIQNDVAFQSDLISPGVPRRSPAGRGADSGYRPTL